MVRAIAMTRCRGGAAKLGCDLVDRAERPVTAGGIEFEDRTRLHREAVINWWRRQHDSGSRWSGARSSLLRIGMFGVLSFQQAFPEQSLHLSAYGGARAAQAICDLCGCALRPQATSSRSSSSVQRDMTVLGHGGPSAWCHACRFVRRHFGDGPLAASAKAPGHSRTSAHRTTYQCELSSSAFLHSGRWRGYRWGRGLLERF